MQATTKNINVVNAGNTIKVSINYKTEPEAHQQMNIMSEDTIFADLWKSDHLDILLNKEKISTINNGNIDLGT